MLNYKVRTRRHINIIIFSGEFGLSQGRKKFRKICIAIANCIVNLLIKLFSDLFFFER